MHVAITIAAGPLNHALSPRVHRRGEDRAANVEFLECNGVSSSALLAFLRAIGDASISHPAHPPNRRPAANYALIDTRHVAVARERIPADDKSPFARKNTADSEDTELR